MSSSSSTTIESREETTEHVPKGEGSATPVVDSTSRVEKTKEHKHIGVGKKTPAAEIGQTTKEKETPTKAKLAPPFRLENEDVGVMSEDLDAMVISENDPLGLEMNSAMAGTWSGLSADDLALPLESEAAKMAKENENI